MKNIEEEQIHLNKMLFQKADCQLEQMLNKLFEPLVEKVSFNSSVKEVPRDTLNKVQTWAEIKRDVGAIHVLFLAKHSMIEALRQPNRVRYVAEFIDKVDSLESQITELKEEISQTH
jgi:predicted transcriptional regulator